MTTPTPETTPAPTSAPVMKQRPRKKPGNYVVKYNDGSTDVRDSVDMKVEQMARFFELQEHESAEVRAIANRGLRQIAEQAVLGEADPVIRSVVATRARELRSRKGSAQELADFLKGRGHNSATLSKEFLIDAQAHFTAGERTVSERQVRRWFAEAKAKNLLT